jgi:hypothetical protein
MDQEEKNRTDKNNESQLDFFKCISLRRLAPAVQEIWCEQQDRTGSGSVAKRGYLQNLPRARSKFA